VGRHKKNNRHLPRGVTLEHGAYFYRGPDRKRINLGRDFAGAMIRYGEMFRDDPLSSFGAVLDRYLREITPAKAERTQIDERRYIGVLRALFGEVPPRAITPVMVLTMRDKLRAKHGAVQANHHLKTLRHVCKLATGWGAMPVNPTREIERLKVKDRERYVDDDELAKVYAKAPEMIQIAIDLAVLTGLRRGDLLELTKDQCRDDGIHVRTNKTGKPLIIEWSDELRAVVERAKLMKPHFRQPLIATRSGTAFTADGFGTLWRRAMLATFPIADDATAAEKVKVRAARFRFHDLRSKSASDTKDLAEASARLGHTSHAVTRRHYVRKPAKVRPLR
jgi:integrase